MDISATLDQIRTMSVEDRIQLIQAIQDTIPDLKTDSSLLGIDLDSSSLAWEKAMQQIEANQPQSLDRLLQSWEDEGDSQEHLETWEFLKQALDEDRISNRSLFS
jgi:hypothetical protein